ncbi:HNH endonuclease signature motif containing protein [Microbispora sp. NPDC049633]|uniref:HNH endonuclease n=1 Tax=Microbispora sp. NPDC049633 TaxID=3154355 RepID=UPI0034368CA8
MTAENRADSRDYPAEAYAPNGQLWWRLRYQPGTRRPFGDERKLAAWLTFNVNEGDTFTMADLRRGLGDEVPNDAEHLNRRLRALRPDGWRIPSNTDDRTLPIGTYRLEAKGWHPGLGPRPKRDAVSDADRRRIFNRDGWRCVVCGVGSGEPYPENPDSKAVLTVGHRVARDLGGSVELDNLQTECKRCNEPLRHELGFPETLTELLPEVKRFRKSELEILLSWLQAKQRIRNRVDAAYDRARRLSEGEQEQLKHTLRKMIQGSREGNSS